MTAKEMFRNLGFENGLLEKNYIITYSSKIEGEIIFHTKERYCHTDIFVDGALHKAIHQQMLELGWLE